MPCLSGFELYSRWVPLKIARANLGELWRVVYRVNLVVSFT